MQELTYKPAEIVTTFKIIKVWIILGPKRCQVFQEFMGSRYALQTCQKGKKKKPNVPSNPLERPINHLISTNNTPDWLFQQQYFKKISGVHVSEFTVKGRASDISRGRGPAKFRYFREILRNSPKNAKYREIRQNISKYLSAKHI